MAEERIEKIFLRQGFEGIERIYPDAEIHYLPEEMEIEDPMAYLKCVYCGSETPLVSLPHWKIPVEYVVWIENGQLQFQLTPESRLPAFDLFGNWEGDLDPRVNRLYDYFANGGGLTCMRCGGPVTSLPLVMEFHADCPGCHVCEKEYTVEDARMLCVESAFWGHCRPGRDCPGCDKNYVRVKYGVTTEEIDDRVYELKTD